MTWRAIRCKWCGALQDPYTDDDPRLLCDRCRMGRGHTTGCVVDPDPAARAAALDRIRALLRDARMVMEEPGHWHSDMTTGSAGVSRSAAAGDLIYQADDLARHSFGRSLRLNPIRYAWHGGSTVPEPVVPRPYESPWDRPAPPPLTDDDDVVFDRPGRGGRPVKRRRRSKCIKMDGR
jgi:hypothetical protein